MQPCKDTGDLWEWLNGRTQFGVRPGLGRMQWALDRLGRPERDLRFIHVAGTNGKGSTCAFLSAILRSAGHRTGLFISPPIEGECSRISVDGVPIREEELSRYVRVIRPLTAELERRTDLGPMTHFEVWTLAALMHFHETKPDVVVWETGLGGKLDSTNVVMPEVSVITGIGLDHTAVLGHTMEHIAKEKAGIIKSGRPVFTAARGPALRVLEETAGALGSRLWCLGRDYWVTDRRVIRPSAESPPVGQRFCWVGGEERLPDLEIPLHGEFQCENAATAVAVARYLDAGGRLPIPVPSVYRGLKTARWPGRVEVAGTSPLLVFDGAHNPDGARSLAAALEEMRPGRWGFVIGVLQDKDVDGIVAALAGTAAWMVAGTPGTPRAMNSDELAERMRRVGVKVPAVLRDPAAALHAALALGGPGGAVCVTGSLYMVMEARSGLNPRVKSQ
ncbi:MAG: folylpolyglutamate synthase/dihydrofolate synthase family protein [Kyrpidia sp.]|nr:folylpolyglutamate synthase/dihydrofolate synthase family protein [Kyrpidia sp.]